MVADKAYPPTSRSRPGCGSTPGPAATGRGPGVSLSQDADGPGYNLLFRDGGVQFLDDHVAWGNYYPFAWGVGAWYHFRLRSSGGVLYGKVWPDGAAEPSGWMFAQSGWGGRRAARRGSTAAPGAPPPPSTTSS